LRLILRQKELIVLPGPFQGPFDLFIERFASGQKQGLAERFWHKCSKALGRASLDLQRGREMAEEALAQNRSKPGGHAQAQPSREHFS
jgi:hypothetical protein